MDAPASHRGKHLVQADRGFLTGNGLFARAMGAGFERILRRIDTGLEYGAIDGTLPDGTRRMLGGRRPGPTAIVKLIDWHALVRLARSGSVGWYKAWEQGEWESPDPVPLFDLFVRNRKGLGSTARASGISRLVNAAAHFLRRNSRSGARRNIGFHYDLGNDFYSAWLDETMTYSSAVFAEPISAGEQLCDAQQRKMEHIADRLQLQERATVLEIGCGWGAMSRHLAQEKGAHVTAITLSEEQKKYAEKLQGDLPVDYRLIDYRDVEGQFDGIVSVEMVEAVGQQYWPAYLDAIAGNLKPGGRAALQYISIADDVFESYASSADFIQTYIFPGGMLLSESRFQKLAGERGLKWQDQHDFGLHYAETLRRWRVNFDTAVEAGGLPQGFDSYFVRLWRYYLMYCEGGFRGGGINVSQVTLVKE